MAGREAGDGLTRRDLTELRRTIAYLPEPGGNLTLMLWTRTGMAELGFPAGVFSADHVIG